MLDLWIHKPFDPDPGGNGVGESGTWNTPPRQGVRDGYPSDPAGCTPGDTGNPSRSLPCHDGSPGRAPSPRGSPRPRSAAVQALIPSIPTGLLQDSTPSGSSPKRPHMVPCPAVGCIPGILFVVYPVIGPVIEIPVFADRAHPDAEPAGGNVPPREFL